MKFYISLVGCIALFVAFFMIVPMLISSADGLAFAAGVVLLLVFIPIIFKSVKYTISKGKKYLTKSKH